MKDSSGPAFPTKLMLAIPSPFDSGNIPKEVEFPGMSLRDYFAAKAMQGILSSPETKNINGPLDDVPEATVADSIAKNAYFMADAMLSAREEKKDA